MEIKDLKPNTGNVDLVLEVVSKEEPRTFEKFGKSGSVCNVTVKDNSGKVKVTLWNDDVERVNLGDKIHIKNGWCSDYKGELQVSSGKFGKIEVLESNSNEILTNDPEMIKKQMSQTGDADEDEDSESDSVSDEDLDIIDDEEVIE
ncbi:hypothetical protein COY27_02640 [Candidatus Woesearchaeota archaeon CG_4_10_14_0_2_um_filter_33_13]|nr:MAG: hypothetical protein COY27_02640 [Candidatus Woesearchaeota archaeon CG_4_10_14_0_2_um_filter_33_13]